MEKQKGSTMYLTVILLGIILTVALGVTMIVLEGANLISGMGDSVVAFHAADTGIEQGLYNVRKLDNQDSFDNLTAFTTYGYSVEIVPDTSISSQGVYKESKRRIQASW